jgi:hypothetical protein
LLASGLTKPASYLQRSKALSDSDKPKKNNNDDANTQEAPELNEATADVMVDGIVTPKDEDELKFRIFMLKNQARIKMWQETHDEHEKLPIISTFDNGYAWLNRKQRRQG